MGFSEVIYLISDSLDNLVKLDLLIEKELLDLIQILNSNLT